MVYIYGLADPETQHLRYVGKATDLRRRLREHLQTKVHNHAGCWIRFLLAAGRQPEIFPIEEVADDGWQEAERFWIGYFRFIGADMINGSPGGLGGSNRGHQMSPEANARRVAAVQAVCRGRKLSQEQIEATRIWHTGRKATPKTRQRMSESAKARCADPAEIERRRLASTGENNGRYGIHCSEETKALIAAAKRGKPGCHHSAETKVRMAVAKMGARNPRYGQHYTQEERRLHSERSREAWQRRKAAEVNQSE